MQIFLRNRADQLQTAGECTIFVRNTMLRTRSMSNDLRTLYQSYTYQMLDD